MSTHEYMLLVQPMNAKSTLWMEYVDRAVTVFKQKFSQIFCRDCKLQELHHCQLIWNGKSWETPFGY